MGAAIDRVQRAPALRGALDGNLGFPAAAPYWASYFAAEGCTIESYTDLGVLSGLLRCHERDCCYLPAANF